MIPWNAHQPTTVSSHYAQAYQHPIPQPTLPASTSSHFGSHRCTYNKCSFSGTQKSVEIHMIDRHLIRPPNHPCFKRDDWDADPSLKGKQIPIQGTNIILKTKEDIDAWIAERKRRFPTASRVIEKEEKLKQAIARGQLHLDDNPRFPKRPRTTGRGARSRGAGFPSRGRHQPFVGPSTTRPLHALPPRPTLIAHPPSPSSTSSSDSDDGPPESLSTKLVELPLHNSDPNIPEQEQSRRTELAEQAPLQPSSAIAQLKKPVVRHPKNPPSNPFASKPSLLRNLLLPEIRNTISNLSQAIRFLVDNDFLENVELNPGDAGQQKIQVVTSEHSSGNAEIIVGL